MKKIFISLIALAMAGGINAQSIQIMQGSTVVATYDDSEYSMVVFEEEFSSDCVTGTASVLRTSGRSSCGFVQLWAGGPRWAEFNVGATITDYANLTMGADSTLFDTNAELAPYCNTANAGGLYAWRNPALNGRQTTWDDSVSTGVTDVATSLWGSNWKTPDYQQLDTLHDSSYGKTTWTWCDGSTTQYVAGCTLRGYRVSGVGEYADKSIFLPAAGYFNEDNGRIGNVGDYGYYWSRTENTTENSFRLFFSSTGRRVFRCNNERGNSVRAILVK